MEIFINALVSWLVSKVFDEGIKIFQKYILEKKKDDYPQNDKQAPKRDEYEKDC